MSTQTLGAALLELSKHPSVDATMNVVKGSAIDPIYAMSKIIGACPGPIPTLPPFSTPGFDDFGSLAAMVGGDPGRFQDAAVALTQQRDEISDLLVSGGVYVATATAELVSTAYSMVRNAMAAAAAATAGGPLAQLAAAAPVVAAGLTKAGLILDSLGKDLDSLAGRLDDTTLARRAQAALKASPIAQEAERTLQRLSDQSGIGPLKHALIDAPRTSPTAAPTHATHAAALGGDGEPPELGPAADDAGDVGDAAPSAAGAAAVQAAKSQLGTPYVWGGSQPGGFDCSGLTSWAYGQAGVDIPRTAAEQAIGQQVAYEDLQQGDLIVWSGHVAMYAGDGMMIEAGDPVQLNPVRTENIGMPFQGFWRPTA